MEVAGTSTMMQPAAFPVLWEHSQGLGAALRPEGHPRVLGMCSRALGFLEDDPAPFEPVSPDPHAPNHTGLSSTKISRRKDGAVAAPRIWEKHREAEHDLSRAKKSSSWVLWANPTMTTSGGNGNYWGKGPVTNRGGLTGVTGADILQHSWSSEFQAGRDLGKVWKKKRFCCSP